MEHMDLVELTTQGYVKERAGTGTPSTSPSIKSTLVGGKTAKRLDPSVAARTTGCMVGFLPVLPHALLEVLGSSAAGERSLACVHDL